jgi:hypothetical protein
MAHLIKALTGTGKVSVDLVSAFLILMGGLLLIGSCVYRVFVQPEWTFEEALNALWPFFLAGTACLALGWFIDRRQN